MMSTMQLETQMEFLVRILLAGIRGGIIGYKRRNRNKKVGVCTHLIVTSGAVLTMIVSKYESSDILGDKGTTLDPPHITTQAVTGVGFLEAGMIFVWKNTISGLTATTGIWATSTIGIAVGSDLHVLGILTAVLIVFVQIILHRNHRWLWESYKEELSFVIDQNKRALQGLQGRLERMQIRVPDVSLTQEHGCYQADLIVVLSDTYQAAKLLDMFHDVAHIYRIDAQGTAKS